MNTIELSREGKVGREIIYYLTKVSEELCDKFEGMGKETTMEMLREVVGNDKAILIAIGDGMKLQSHRIEPILMKLDNGHYRCYDIPLEREEKLKNIVKVCEDTKTCWQSALRAIGYKQASGLRTPAYYNAYAIIWKEVN